MSQKPTSSIPLDELFAIDPRSLAALRIALALSVLADLVYRFPAIADFYTAEGVLPAPVLRELTNVPLLSLHLLFDSWGYQALLFSLAGFAALLMLVGLWTRLACGLTLVMTYSLHVRNPLTLQYADQMLFAMLLWSAFLPLGCRASIDVLRDPSLRRVRPVRNLATVAAILQGVFVYFVTGVTKLYSEAWVEGHALYATLQRTLQVRPLSAHLLPFPGLLRVGTWAALVVELVVPLCVISPWRTVSLRSIAIALTVALQLGIFVMLDLGLFQPITMVLVCPWIPATVWDRWTPFRNEGPTGAAETLPLAHPVRALAAGLLSLVTLYNVLALFPNPPQPPRLLQTVGLTLRVHQKWRMFDDARNTPQGWFVVGGRRADGRVVDLPSGRDTISLERSVGARSEVVPNTLWAAYLRQLLNPRHQALRLHLTRYYCRRFNHDLSGPERLVRAEVLYMRYRNYEPADAPTEEQVLLAQATCP